MSSVRDEYVEKMKSKLDEWNREIDALEQKVSTATGPAREKLGAHLEEIRKSYEAGRKKLDELRAAGESSWENAKGEAEHLWKTLRQSINYFRSQL